MSSARLCSLELTFEEYREAARTPGTVLVDVRSQTERGHRRLPGSRWYPLEHVYADVDAGELTLNPNVATVFHCACGTRSRQLVEDLRAQGFHHTYSLAGGIDAWPQEERSP